MAELYIRKETTLEPDDEDVVVGRSRLPSTINRRGARRMTHLGTLIARVLDPESIDLDSTLVYGSTYAGSRTLEGYVDSFPNPSPLLFQSSIHPSAVQQVFVASRASVNEFIPLCGGPYLVASMFNTAFCARTARTLLVGAEERGEWMLDLGLASAESWAWCIELSQEAEGALGTVSKIDGQSPATIPPVTHERFFRNLSDRRDLSIPSPDGGVFRVVLT